MGVGARHESASLSGVSHLIEHMCFKGTQKMPDAHQISQAIEGIGGILDAETSYESTVFWVKVADIHIDLALHLLTELVRHPLLAAEELEKERRVIIEEIRGLQDTPGDWIDTLIHESLWGDQPLGRDIAGSVESVGAISQKEMHTFWHQHYSPQSMVVSVAGNINTGEIIQRIATAFDQHTTELPPPALPTSPPVPGPHLTLQHRTTEQGNFCLGLPGLSYNDPDRRAMDVLDTVLGGGMSSRLFQELREERGLAYSVGSYHTRFADAGMWVVYGSVEPETLYDSVRLSLDMLRDLAHNGISEEELRHVKERVKGGILISLEDTWSVASRNGSLQLRYGEVPPVERVVAEFEAVTCADVLRVARRILQPNRLHLAVIGPYRSERRLRSLIENWTV
jgi:predicted Zn-dependent peptidase